MTNLEVSFILILLRLESSFYEVYSMVKQDGTTCSPKPISEIIMTINRDFSSENDLSFMLIVSLKPTSPIT